MSTEPAPEPLTAEAWSVLNRILNVGQFGHHIKGDPDEGPWRCTCGAFDDDEKDWMTAEQHIAEVTFRGAFPFLAAPATPSSVTPDLRPAIDGVQYVIVSPGQPIDSATGEPLGYNEIAVNGVARQSLAQLIETATANGLSVRLASSDEARALRLGSAVER